MQYPSGKSVISNSEKAAAAGIICDRLLTDFNESSENLSQKEKLEFRLEFLKIWDERILIMRKLSDYVYKYFIHAIEKE